MPWTAKSFKYEGVLINGTLHVPPVNEDLFEENGLEEAKKAARPVFEIDRGSLIQNVDSLSYEDIDKLGKDLFEIGYKLQDLTQDQNREVERLLAVIEAGKHESDEG